MANSEARSALLSAGFRIPVLAVSAVCSFITTRLLIDYGGVEAYAFAALLFSLTVMLPFADFGVGAAVVNAVAQSQSPSVDTSVFRVALTAARVLVGSAIALVVSAAAVAVLGGWRIVTGDVAHELAHVDLAVWLGISCFALGLPLGLSQRILLGMNRNHLYVLTSGLSSPLALGVAWVAIRAGAPAALAGVALPAGILLGLCVTWVVALRGTQIPLNEVLRRVPQVRAHAGNRIRKTALPMAIIVAGTPVALQADRLILSHQSSTHQVALYSITAQLFSPVLAVLSTGGLSLWPIFARRRARGESGLKLLSLALFAICAAAVAATSMLLAVGPWLGNLLSGGEVSVSLSLVAVFGAFALAYGAQATVGASLTSESGLRFQSGLVVIMVPVNLWLSWYLAASLGALGPVIASAATFLALQVAPNIVYFRHLEFGRQQDVQQQIAQETAG